MKMELIIHVIYRCFPRHARIPIRVYSTLHIDFDTLNEFHITKGEVDELFPIGGYYQFCPFKSAFSFHFIELTRDFHAPFENLLIS